MNSAPVTIAILEYSQFMSATGIKTSVVATMIQE
jgi:hypothetical protein